MNEIVITVSVKEKLALIDKDVVVEGNPRELDAHKHEIYTFYSQRKTRVGLEEILKTAFCNPKKILQVIHIKLYM